MANVLPLEEDDFTGDDIQESIESAFGIAFTREEMGSIATVGDLQDLVARKLGNGNGACLNLMTFLRLRRALTSLAPRSSLRPDTPLRPLAGRSPRKLMRALANRTGLTMPGLALGLLGELAIVAFLVAAAITIVVHAAMDSALATAATAGAGLVFISLMLTLDRRRIPDDLSTLGDLSRAVANRNPGRLASWGGRLDDRTIWQALVAAVSPHVADASFVIERDTRFAP